MRCVSKGRPVRRRSASTTGGPKVMLSTKRPSMMSTWTQSAPLSSMVLRPPARSAKSAERMLGATRGRLMGARWEGPPQSPVGSAGDAQGGQLGLVGRDVEEAQRGLGVGAVVRREPLADVAGGDAEGRLEGHEDRADDEAVGPKESG